MRKTLFGTLLTVMLVGKLSAQAYELPIYYGQYFNDPQINPIQLREAIDYQFSLGHRRNGQQFAGVNTSLFSGQMKLGQEGKSGFHEVGLHLISDREGFVIRRNRLGAKYARHQRISSNYMLAAGMYLGTMNYAIKSNDVTGGFSSYALDGIISLKLYNEKTAIGFSINQVTNARITPVNSEIILPRHLNAFIQHRFVANDHFTFIPSLYSRYIGQQTRLHNEFSLAGGLRMLIRNKFMAGFNSETKQGSYVLLGIENIAFTKSVMSLNLAYFIPNRNAIAGNVQRFEVFLRYQLKNNKA